MYLQILCLLLWILFPTYLGAQGVMESYHFVRLRDGAILKSKNPDQLLSPASTTKLITSAAALSVFGPFAKRETKWFALGPIQNGVLKGDLLVQGDADPFLVLEHLWQISCDLRSLGLKTVTGSLVLDNSLFAKDLEAEKGLRDFRASSHSYDAPVSALAISFNTVALAVAPGAEAGSPAIVQADPYPLDGIKITNRVTTGAPCKKSSCPDTVEATRVNLGKNHYEIILSGGIPMDSPVKKVYRSVDDPVMMSGAYIKAFLKHEGITVNGTTREHSGPTHQGKLIYTWTSQPMHQIIQSLNYYSNNYMSDTIWKTLGTRHKPKGASYDDGFQVVNQFLRKEVGLTGEYTFANGSGYSTENKVTSKQLVTLLRHMHDRQDLFAPYLESLPTSGKTGSLKNRFKHLPTNSLVKAKTGTLREPIAVSSLAGYWIHPKEGLVAFAILLNGTAGDRQPTQDELHARVEELF